MSEMTEPDGLREILEKVALSHGCLDDYGNDWNEQLETIDEAEAAIRQYFAGKLPEKVVEPDKYGKLGKPTVLEALSGPAGYNAAIEDCYKAIMNTDKEQQ